MKKGMVLKIVNFLLFFSILTQALSGFFHSKLSLEAFEWLHERNGLVLVILSGLHIWLNRSWIRTNFLNFSKK